ncbi:MAG: DUF4382 domain-containing protein [Bacteroidetes bacterium]|nr:DUF4382 domain-containing protein [Bacteroidota bacterium]
MKTNIRLLAAFGGIMGIVLFMACNKNNAGVSNIPPGKSQMSLYITDGPISFYKVLIDIRQVAVLIDTATVQNASDDPEEWGDGYYGRGRGENNKSVIWDTLSITPGIYDLLKLRNGVDTLLGSGIYPTGKVIKIKITLGSDNTLYTDSLTSYPLEIFGFNPYFTVNVARENMYSVANNDFKLWLDFNLQRSIFFWSGTYYLKPYLVAFNDVKLSKIKGMVLPKGASALVEAYKNNDTLYTIPEWEGDYQFRGVSSGTYSMTFKGRNGYKDTTITNIVVDSASTTTAPTITLHQ